MRLVLYFDPFICPISYFYIYELLIQELNKLNHTLTIHIPNIANNKTQNEDCYINKHNTNIINWSIPDVTEYDILLLPHIWSKKWDNGNDMRVTLTNGFLKHNKKVLCLKVDTTLEHRYINNNVQYGVNSLFNFNLSSHWTLPKNASRFVFHQLANLSFNKPTALTKEEFYSKYNINVEKKIIVFFMSRYKKWVSVFRNFTYPIHWILRNLKQVESLLDKYGYKLVFKLHRSDGLAIVNQYKLQNITIIDNFDAHELVKYADRAITFGSTVVYELYLYNLPTLEIGDGIYYPGWLSFKMRDLPIESPLKGYDNGRSLIYGKILKYRNFDNEFMKQFKKYIKMEFNIDDYKYKLNHPIYGDSYNSTVETIANQLHNEILCN
jgi:hypothetical protein